MGKTKSPITTKIVNNEGIGDKCALSPIPLQGQKLPP